MQRLKRSWWLIPILVIGLGIVGQVQAQGGWSQWVQGVVRTLRQTTHALSAWLKGTEEQPAVQKEERPSESQTTVAAPSVAPQRKTSQSVSPPSLPASEENWLMRLFETIPPSEGALSTESVPEAPRVGSDASGAFQEASQETEASGAAEWEWFSELLAPPVPSYWDWDEEEWLKTLLGDPEQASLSAEQIQDRILEEIRRESEAVQEQWELLQQLEALDRAYSEGEAPSSSDGNTEVNE